MGLAHMPFMDVLMGTMLSRVLMDFPAILVRVRVAVFVFVLVGMDMNMLVGVLAYFGMLVFMLVFMLVLVGMLVVMLVIVFHGNLLLVEDNSFSAFV